MISLISRFALSLVASTFVAGLATGCSLEPMEGGGNTATPYRDGFARVNRTAFESEIAPGTMIDVWVSEDALEAYSKVLLDGENSGITLPEGTVIVREVLDDAYNIKTLTLMIKGAPGYYPEGGDYWYGVAEPDGTMRADEGGNLLMGRLTDCGSCHAQRANDDFLFGIPSGYHY